MIEVSVKEPLEKLRRLRTSLILNINTSGGFRNVQSVLVKAVRQALIDNVTQQKILEICQPLRQGRVGPETRQSMAKEIHQVIDREVENWREVLKQI